MNLLSGISRRKIEFLGTIIEIRSTLHVLGLISDDEAENKNKRDVFKVIELSNNLSEKDRLILAKKSGH